MEGGVRKEVEMVPEKFNLKEARERSERGS